MMTNITASKNRRLSVGDIKVKDIDLILAGLLFFDSLGGIDGAIVTYIEYCLTAYLFLKYIKTLPSIVGPSVLLGIFSVLLAFSTWQNTHSATWALSGFVFGVQIISLMLVFVDQCRRLSTDKVLERIAVLFALVLLVNDIAMILLPYDRDYSGTAYIAGNKFGVSYAHCLLVGLLMVVKRGHDALIRCVAIVGLAMNYYAGSSTGAVMMAAMLALSFLPDGFRRIVSRPVALAASIAVLNVLIWGAADLLHNPFVQDFIVNVLGKSADLTGRERLYKATFDFVAEKPWLGWGYLTDIYRITFGYGNAQNGLFHLVTQSGILGTALYFLGLFFSLVRKETNGTELFGLYAFLFAMILGSAVEINLSSQFAFGVALLCGALRDSARREE